MNARIRRGFAQCAAAAVCFGAATPITRRLLNDSEPVALAGLLYLGAAIASLPFALRRQMLEVPRPDLAKVATAVFVGAAVAPVLLLQGLERVPAPTVSILLNLELVATVLLAWVVFRERIDRTTALGVTLILAAGLSLTWGSVDSIGPAALLIAAACAGWGIDNATTASVKALTPAQITAVKGALAGTVNLALGLTLWPDDRPTLATALGGLAVGAIGYGASMVMWIAGARVIGASRGQAVFATAPFVGILLAWPITGERIGGRAGVAVALAAVGVVAVTRQSETRAHRHGATTHRHRHRHDDDHHDHVHDFDHRAGAQGRQGRHTHTHTHAPREHAHAERHSLRNR